MTTTTALEAAPGSLALFPVPDPFGTPDLFDSAPADLSARMTTAAEHDEADARFYGATA